MNNLLFIKGFIVGATVAFPIGPIGILCLRRMLTQGPLVGLASGIGGATADIIYALVALIGLSFVSHVLAAHVTILCLISGIFMIALGIKTIHARMPTIKKTHIHSIMQAYLSTLLLTLANPLIILTFAALFTAFNIIIIHQGHYYLLMTGLFLGSCFWWFLLAIIHTVFHIKLLPHSFKRINYISGSAIIAFGILTLARSFIK